MSTAALRDSGWKFHFRRFHAVDHRLKEIDLRWRFNPAQPITSISELAMLVFWKVAYRVDDRSPAMQRPRTSRGMRG
jgi:hypothetical protein